MITINVLRFVCHIAAATLVAASATGAWPANDSPVAAGCITGVGCQFSNLRGWGLSDGNPNGPLEAMDNMKVTASGTIGKLCWWGVYFDFGTFADCGPGTGDSFTVTYYNDDACGAVPGSLRAGPLPLTMSAKFPTGNIASGSGISMAEFQYEATHAPVAVNSGECLWIKILNHTTQSCFWLWSSAFSADGRSAQGGFFGLTPQPFDLAFCVDIATTSDGCNSSLATSYCTSKVNSAGCTPKIVASMQDYNLILSAEQVLPDQTGILLYSVQGADGAPFQGGFLCVLQPVSRTAAQTSSATGSPPCTGIYSFDFSAHVASGVDPSLVPGQQVWAQYWMRDLAATFGTGLTNGLMFTICQ